MDTDSFEILCIDDEIAILEVYKQWIEKWGYRPITMSSPTQALEYIKSHSRKICLILCDYNMPEINGFELISLLSPEFSSIPFVLISGYLSPETISEDIKSKISGIYSKPFDLQTLQNCVRGSHSNHATAYKESREMMLGFVEEASSKLEEMENLLLQLETEPDNKDILSGVCRALHTIKGTAACIGLNSISSFSHDCEDSIAKISNQNMKTPIYLFTSLLQACEQMHMMFEDIILGKTPDYNADYWRALLSGEKEMIPDVIEDSSDQKKDEAPKTNHKISVSSEVLGEFIEHSGNLTILRNYLVQKTEILIEKYPNEKNLLSIVEYLDEIQKENSFLQNKASDLKKVAFADLLKPLKRMVRDTALKMNKKVQLKIEGESLLLDYNIAKALADSLVHLIRNSMDHGIEPPAERIQTGKAEEATLTISLQLTDSQIKLSVADDGRGINILNIKKKLIERELCSEAQAADMSQEAVLLWIFHSGFSTSDKVTDISGRGVGMDMVKKSIESMNGKIAIKTEPMTGTRFDIELPVVKSVNIKVAVILGVDPTNQVAILYDQILEINETKKMIENGRLTYTNGAYYLNCNGQYIYALPLSRYLNSSNSNIQLDANEELSNSSLLITIGTDAGAAAFFAMDVKRSEELLVKTLPGPLFADGTFTKAALSGRFGLVMLLDYIVMNKINSTLTFQNTKKRLCK